MTAGAPWSVKGIDPKAREVAKDLARRSGMTLGEWLNQVILQDDGPEDIVSESYFSERPARSRSEALAAPPRPVERFEAPEHPGDYVERMAGLLDRLTARIETAEARTGQAVSGVELSVRDALARIEAAERQHAAVAFRVEGAAEQSAALHARLADRLSRVEDQATGPRSTEALRALEGAISKVAGQVYEGEQKTRDTIAAVEARLESVEAKPLDGQALIEQVVSRLGERLAEAEGRTAQAVESLRQSFAALDGRLNSVESGVGPAIEQRLEALTAQLTGSLDEARAEIAEKIQGAADGKIDKMEQTLGEMAEHVRAAEQRSAQAIENMGREVLNIADVLNRRVQAAEARTTEAIDKVGGEMARVAQSVDTRLSRSETIHAEALEKLSGEISRITERLAERIANAERRSAQAIDDVGEQVARVTERINHRAERTSEDLAERIRQSEERTARLLEDAREKIDQRLAETQRRAVTPPELEVAPATIALGAFPAAEPARAPAFLDDPFAGFPSVDDETAQDTAPEPSASDFMARAFPSPAASAERAAPSPTLSPDEAFDADDEFLTAASTADDDVDAQIAAEIEAAEAFAAAAPTPEDDDEAFAAPLSASAELADDDNQAPAAFDADSAFTADDAFGPLEAVGDASVDDLFDLADPEPAAPARPLTTREVVEQARAAARAAAQSGDAKGRKGKGPNKAASPLFSNFGLSRPKRRAGSTLQTFLMVSGGAAFLGLAAGGVVMMNAKPAGAPPKRVAEALARDEAASVPVAVTEADTTPFPRASVALSPQPISPTPETRMTTPDVAATPATDLPALYAGAVAAIEAGEPGGLEALKKTANLGHAPAQLYLGKLYEEGKSGVKKDLGEARRWTERAAAGGDRRAMHNTALYYFNGEGGPKDAAAAAQWFRRAADLGLVDSQFNLGRLYEEGLGVAQNGAEAYKWFLIAARAGDEGARSRAQRVGATLTTQGRIVAERTAIAFRPAAPGGAASAGDLTSRTAQRALSKLGYYQGPTDGSASPALKLAVAAYQRDQGLPATGALDSTTVSRLAVFTR